VKADVAAHQTKLKHVDSHSHQLREAHREGRIHVDYNSTGDMLANRLTEALTNIAFQGFKEQVGLVNIRDRIETRKLRELHAEEFDHFKDTVEGGGRTNLR
jgi:hypothetical protein